MSAAASAAPDDRTIWAALPVPAFVLSPDDLIEDANPEAETFLNRAARALRGRALEDALRFGTDLGDAMARVRASRAPVLVSDVDAGAPGRSPVACDVTIGPLDARARSGRLVVLVIPREMASRARRGGDPDGGARAAIGMAEMLAHEIKNPLAGITGAAQLLSMNLTDGDREMTDLIVAESRRIVKLLEQVEQFGNVRPPDLRPVNLHDVLNRARRSAALGFGAHMTFREDYDPSLPPTEADPDQLTQVFLNLVKNAAEAAPGGGTVTLRTYYDGGLRVTRPGGGRDRLPLHVEVIDDGPGLPDRLRDGAFEPFVSGRENGTGLGLALVAKIVGDHGGWIALETAPGRTMFRISLPVAGAPEED